MPLKQTSTFTAVLEVPIPSGIVALIMGPRSGNRRIVFTSYSNDSMEEAMKPLGEFDMNMWEALQEYGDLTRIL
jgi:hypothetical protein